MIDCDNLHPFCSAESALTNFKNVSILIDSEVSSTIHDDLIVIEVENDEKLKSK